MRSLVNIGKKALPKISKGLLSMHFFSLFPPNEEGLGK